jgi:hypothetical protein
MIGKPFDTEAPPEYMISRALMILVIIGSFPVLQLSPKAMAQTSPSEGAKVLIDDVIQALKSNNIKSVSAFEHTQSGIT